MRTCRLCLHELAFIRQLKAYKEGTIRIISLLNNLTMLVVETGGPGLGALIHTTPDILARIIV